jgi:hypothetical protein
MPTARIILSAALLASVFVPAPGWAQTPLAGVVKTLFDRVTPNATTPNPANPAVNIDHGAHFFLGGENLKRATRELNAALATQLSTFPLASSSGGFTYSISEGGDVVPTSTTFGPSFAERAVTIGRSKLNFGYTFQHTSYSSFEGAEFDSGALGFVSQHNNCCPAPGNPAATTDFLPEFERDLLLSRLVMTLDTNTTAFFANYGVTNRFDIGVAVPIVNVGMDASVTGQIVRTATANNPSIHNFDGVSSSTKTVSENASATGLGDILLRAKYNLFRGTTTSFAAALDLRLPTGDSDNLLGTGATRTQILGIASGEYGRFSPHVNFGYTFSNGTGSSELADVDDPVAQFGAAAAGRVDQDPLDLSIPDEVNYIVGFNVAVHPKVTLGFDMRGRTVRDIARFLVTDVTYPNRGPGTPGAPFVAEDEFALEEPTRGNLNQMLGVIGGKINIAGTFLLNVTVLIPMSDDGLKPKPTPVIGFDYVF